MTILKALFLNRVLLRVGFVVFLLQFLSFPISYLHVYDGMTVNTGDGV